VGGAHINIRVVIIVWQVSIGYLTWEMNAIKHSPNQEDLANGRILRAITQHGEMELWAFMGSKRKGAGNHVDAINGLKATRG